MPGWLDIGTTGYTNSRIRCNAEVGGFMGYAELRAYSSYDMFLILSTTRTDGGWMYFKINNDSYMQLSGSDNKVNIYKDTSVSGNLDVGGIMNTTKINLTNDDPNSFPSVITNTGGNWFQGGCIATANQVGCLFAYKASGSSTPWWSGVWGANTNDFNIWFSYKGLSIKSNGSATINGNLDVGVGAASSITKAHGNHDGSTGSLQLEARWRNQSLLSFDTTYGHGYVLFIIKNDYHMRCGNGSILFYKPTTNASDDRLKENEELLENACETLPKLRSQLYDKKPDIDNDDHTTWYKESGLIAQEVYFDAPELRHLTHKDSPETDEDGNSIPLPEVPTSIDPKQDPDYPSWGKGPASVKLYWVNRIFS